MLKAKSVAAIEHHADASWPALEFLVLHDWHLRHLQGDDNTRPNSALPPLLLHGQENWADDINRVEEFYLARGLDANVQVIHSLTDRLAKQLGQRGYEYAVPSEVLVVDIPRTGKTGPAQASVAVAGGSSFDGVWLDSWRQVTGESSARARVLQKSLCKVTMPTRYVTLTVEGRPAAVGRGTAAAGLLGVFNCATATEYRGQRLIGRVVEELWLWSLSLGITKSYLQLSDSNSAARSAYKRQGYRLAYEYGYMRSQSL